jgi:hypothetical protein
MKTLEKGRAAALWAGWALWRAACVAAAAYVEASKPGAQMSYYK